MPFTNPFRYFPDQAVVKAAEEVMARIDSSDELREAFSEGKMLGVLIVELPAFRHACQSKGRQAAVAEMPFSSACLPLHQIPGFHDFIQDSPHVIPDTLHVIPDYHDSIPGSRHVIPDLIRDLHTNNRTGYLAAFSGSVSGRSVIDGFVPPVFDLLDPSGYFKIKEAEITAINQKIHFRETSSPLSALKQELADAERDRDEEIGLIKARMAVSKRERDEIRMEVSDSSRMAELIRESQFEKAELRRLKLSWEERISRLKDELNALTDEIHDLKVLRAKKSDELQEWIFKQYIVHNALGDESSILDIFAAQGLVPPGGTGDCAAPKLLEHAFRNGLKPIAMGEFWYGKSPETAVRTHGHFYPSCTSKCGPLLGFMLRGMEISEDTGHSGCTCDDHCRPSSGHRSTTGRDGHELEIIYEDEVLIAVNKPSGMPSVPGLDGRVSAYEILRETFGELFTIHRLDMDTSGILLFAKTAEAAVNIQKQFENHTVRKTYLARLSAADKHWGISGPEFPVGDKPEHSAKRESGPSIRSTAELSVGSKGRIELPLSPDYDERPRQKVDFAQGKAAVTDYEVTGLGEDGSLDIVFHPLTGRTHQLRIHAAHTLGLNRPILGDPLYGGSPAPRLHLQAASITFRHPTTNRKVCIELQ